MKRFRKKEKHDGFKKKTKKIVMCKLDGITYVETIAVLAIGAILSAGAVVSATKLISMGRKVTAQSQIYQYRTALQTYFLDCGRFPTTEQGLNALWEKPEFFPIPESWNGPYIDRKPGPDPWGTNFKYLSRESSPLPSEVPKDLPFVLMSLGADCKEGGEGDASDIVSWK